jgi:hypothetical protein
VFLQQWRKAWSYSTPRVLEEFQQNFPDFQALNQQLAQKVYKCVNMFLETGSVLCKKAVGDPQEDQLKILKRVNKELLQRLNQEPNQSSVHTSFRQHNIFIPGLGHRPFNPAQEFPSR